MTVTEPRPLATGGLDATTVVVAGMQRLFVAPVGTAPPADIATEPGDLWADLGYTTEDGLAFSFGLDTDDLMTSQSLDPVRKLTTARPKTIVASLRQFNSVALALALGGGTFTGDDDDWTYEPAPSSFIDERALIAEFEDGANHVRFIYYRTMVSEAVEFTAVNTDGLVFPLTFSVLAADPPYITQGKLAGFGLTPPVVPLVPSLVTVAPDTGVAGDTVTLTGTNFAPNLTVRFGATAATNVSGTGATTRTCTVPAGTAGATVDVVVANPGQAQVGTLADAFTYDAPLQGGTWDSPTVTFDDPAFDWEGQPHP